MTKTKQHPIREHLQALVAKARLLLNTQGDYYTNGAKLALTDMVVAAEMALDGREKLPFIRNREFMAPEAEGAVRFAVRRFTMAPSYNEEGSVFHYYGLEPALEWFGQQDFRRYAGQHLLGKADSVIQQAEALLAEAEIGREIGQYDAASRDGLVRAARRVKTEREHAGGREADSDGLVRAIVHCYNQIREFRFTRVLRTDIDSESTLYLTKEGLQEMKSSAGRDESLRGQAARIKQLANGYSLDDIEKAAAMIMTDDADYDEINKHFYVWSSTDKIVNFTAPENAVKAELSFILPAAENEKDGLGHVWIDNLNILSANKGSLDIRNRGFDEGSGMPYHWNPEARKGSPIMKWEDAYPFRGGGDRAGMAAANPSSQTSFAYEEHTSRHSIYICNPTGNDEGSWVYDGEIAIEGGTGYTLTFAAKIDGKLKSGLKTVIVFKDEKDEVVDQFDYLFNRKSSLANGCFQLTMQCDAIQYAFTEDKTYALKAKHEILYTLNDFCQGAEHWLVTNLRPQGSDSYGAVQGGRLLCSTAVTYSLIKEADVFTEEEKKRFYAMVDYLLRYMLDLRDRTELTPQEAQHGCSNWQTDMCAGAAYMMLVLDDFPNRKAWLYNAHMVLHSQLMLTVNDDHSWPESIRYHHAALERFAGYAKAVSHVMGENWFETTPLADMFGFSLRTQTPGYRHFGGRIGTPPFGDHALSGGSEFGSFGTYLGDIERIDKPLADRMYHTWVLAGKPFKKLWGEGIVLENLLGKGDSFVPDHPLVLGSINDLTNAGIYIFRNNFGSGGESYFAIMSSPQPIGHGHHDQGSFIIYKNSIPLVMDSGIEGYFDSSTSWHISSYSHACLQFSTKRGSMEKSRSTVINLSAGTFSLERGWVDVPRVSQVIACRLGEEVESITIEILNPEGPGRHLRHVRYFKRPDLYLIRDIVTDFGGEVLFNLPVAAKQSAIDGGRVYSEGMYGVDLETVFLSPVNGICIEKGRTSPFFENEEGIAGMMDYVRATADAKDGFKVLLYPKQASGSRLEVTMKDDRTAVVVVQGERLELDLSDPEL